MHAHRLRTLTSSIQMVDHYNVDMQLRFSSPHVVLSRSLSRLADNYVDSTACQIYTADCSYKSNSEYLKTEFEFQFSNFI